MAIGVGSASAWRVAAAGILALALGACTRLGEIAAGTVVTCAGPSDCPSGLVCTHGRCQDASAIDTLPPDLASPVEVAPARVRAGQPFTVRFTVTEPLATTPLVSLALDPPVSVDCAPATTLAYACSYLPTGGEDAGLGGEVSLGVALRDRAGNDTARRDVATVTLDFTPPAPKIAVVAYDPPPSNPLSSARRATAGTQVRVVVSADEALSPAAPRSLVGRLGAATLAFAPSAWPGLAENDAAFVGTLAGVEPDGAYTLAVTWSDPLGNTGTALVPATVEVKTSRPVLHVRQDAVVFVRSPSGNGAAEAIGGFTVPAGPYFALAPLEPLSAATSLPADTFSTGAEAPALVRVWSDGLQGALLGTATPDDAGRWPRLTLQNVDVPQVWVTAVDGAGNESAPVKLANGEWVATAGGRASAGPSAVSLLASAVGSRDPEVADLGEAGLVAGTDALAASVSTGGLWQFRAAAGAGPGLRARHAMAYDSGRGRVVLFGGESESGLQATWEFDGASWRQVAVAGPTPRSDAAMAYDAARGRVVLFGGLGSATRFADTWEWDGTSWILRATTGPSPRASAALAYDPARARLVLFGGYDGAALGDTWEWDGTTWTRRATTGAPARYSAAMAQHGDRGTVVLFGGMGGARLADTWEWNGSDWVQLAITAPAARFEHGMAWDTARHQMILFGGSTGTAAFSDTWVLTGTTWSQPAVGGPAARYSAGLAFDGARGQAVLYGGFGAAGTLHDTWLWNGAAWIAVEGSSPEARSTQALAFDEANGRTILFGGVATGALRDTWAWNGTSWALLATTGPAARSGHAMAYDVSRNQLLLFGGRDASSYGDTWSLAGSTWSQAATTGPSPRYEHAMAYDAARQRIVLFGGYASACLSDTWEWTGTGWASVATSGPPARTRHAMAYSASRGRVILFGGNACSGTPLDDTWEWNGSSWSQLTGPGPAGREWHVLVGDRDRGRVVLFGGIDAAHRRNDTWELVGATWTPVAGAAPTPRYELSGAWDAGRQRVVVFGGVGEAASGTRLSETWEYSAPRTRRPAVQVDVPFAQAAIPASAITQLRVRGYAGARYADQSAAGAALLGWATRGDRNEPGAWIALWSNGTPVAAQPPLLPPAPASLVEWTSPDAGEARRYCVERDGLSFQVRPVGDAGATTDGATVALDYLEVRVRYAMP